MRSVKCLAFKSWGLRSRWVWIDLLFTHFWFLPERLARQGETVIALHNTVQNRVGDPLRAQQSTNLARRLAGANIITFDKAAADFIAVNESGWRNAKHADQWRDTLINATARGEVYAPLKYTGPVGFMLPTPNDGTTYNPHWCARNRHAAGLDKFLTSFGLSPSSRGRVSPGPLQGDLFAEPSATGWNSL
jgi:hypothetical protein